MRVILHVDMDAFYASIEQRDNPSLRGKPVIVGSPPDQRGVVSAASYEARTFGVRSAMPSRTAGKLCPHGIFLPVRMNHYRAVSAQLMTILEQFTPFIEPLSLDEAFLDMTGGMRRWKDPAALARTVKDRIQADLHLTASVGVAPNPYLAKIASDLEKPDGLTVMPRDPAEIARFLAPLPVRRIWGVGAVSGDRLAHHRIFTMGDVQQRSEADLVRILGSPAAAARIRALAYGIDERTLDMEQEEKSVSHEHTFDVDCASSEVLHQVLMELTEQVAHRLREADLLARRIWIKLRFSDFRTITRQQTLPTRSASDRELGRRAGALLDAQHINEPIRLIGFGASQFRETGQKDAQLDLFPDASADPRDERLDRAVDRLREQYGRDILRRGDWRIGAG